MDGHEGIHSVKERTVRRPTDTTSISAALSRPVAAPRARVSTRSASIQWMYTLAFGVLERSSYVRGRDDIHRLRHDGTGIPRRRQATNGVRLATAVVTAANGQTVHVVAESMAATILGEHAADLIEISHRIDAVDIELAVTLARHPLATIVTSMPGIGPILGAELVSITGTMNRYPSPAALAALAGLLPVPRVRHHCRSRASADPLLSQVAEGVLPVGVDGDPALPGVARLLRPQARGGQESPAGDDCPVSWVWCRTADARPLRAFLINAAEPGCGA